MLVSIFKRKFYGHSYRTLIYCLRVLFLFRNRMNNGSSKKKKFKWQQLIVLSSFLSGLGWSRFLRENVFLIKNNNFILYFLSLLLTAILSYGVYF